MRKAQNGFTLVELMIVVAIIGILAAVAIPKFADMLEKSREGATKGNLAALRSSVSNYYADQRGVFPVNLDSATYMVNNNPVPAFIPTYIERLPAVKVTSKNAANGTYPGPGDNPNTASQVTTGTWSNPAFSSLGVGWKYDGAASAGNVWVNSHLLDMNGRTYTNFGYE